MRFISHAQNYEDVMLWRALKHIEHGFYIDVGANDPDSDSVTKSFYQRGWMGINLEPLPTHHRDLQLARPRDINIQCAAGAERGEIDLWEFDIRGWATGDKNVADQHEKNGFKGRLHKVKMLKLAEICDQHVRGDIHFLKVDVEGFEEAVLIGADFERYRPWILVIEATKPNSTEETSFAWESILTEAGYFFCYFDGLNRFYISKEHRELAESFRHPPCVFDNFVKYEQQQLESRIHQVHLNSIRSADRAEKADSHAIHAEARATIDRLKRRLVEAKLLQAEASLNAATAHISEILSSTSWRVTAPIRVIGHWAKQQIGPSLRRVLLPVMRFALARPNLRRAALAMLKLTPGPANRLRILAINRGLIEPAEHTVPDHRKPTPHEKMPVGIKLSVHAFRIRKDLQDAVDQTYGH